MRLRNGILLPLAALAITMGATVLSCNKKDNDSNTGGNNGNSFDRSAMFTNYADNYIVPAYTDMATRLATLKDKADNFASSPDAATLSALRTAWQDAYFTWQKVEILEFGPEASISLRDFMNIYPVSLTKINANINAGSYDLEQFANKDAQGFPAIDYLINGIAATDAGIVTAYTTDAAAAGRKQYLQNVIAKMQSKITAVKDAWGSYKSSFSGNTATNAGGSLSLMTNAYVLYYERYVRSGKIGLPVGAMSGTAAPELAESYYYPTIGRDLANAAVSSVIAVYEGKSYDGATDGLGFKDYMTAIGTKDNDGTPIADVITNELAEVKAKMGTLSPSLKDAVVNDRTNVLNLYDEMQQVVPLIKVDMVSAFGISITYTDNDGD